MLTDAQTTAWLTVRLAPNMSRARLAALVRRFAAPEEILGASAAEIASVRTFDPATARTFLSSLSTAVVKRELDRMAEFGVSLRTPSCPDYPENLWRSSVPPPLLYVRGALSPRDRYSVAIVGTREPTAYGLAVASRFSSGFVRYGLTVVSGFARGIDSAAHQACLDAGGRTIAVLGCGLAVPYPQGSSGLARRIVENQGAIVSEYPMDAPPAAPNFPERNYIIAALSLGTVVAEAADRSGALITAHQALEENRFVFAVPGDITRPNSRGTNKLIRQGEARLVQSPDEVLEEMSELLSGYLTAEKCAPEVGSSREESAEDSPLIACDVEWGKKTTGSNAVVETPLPAPQSARADHDGLPKAVLQEKAVPSAPVPLASSIAASAELAGAPEKLILKALQQTPQHFDALASELSPEPIPVSKLAALLLGLELKRAIVQLPGRIYKVSET